MQRYLILLFLLIATLLFSSCKKKANCSDGKLNGNEIRTDCGGDCDPCETCSDGVKNQDETSTDCGGVCPKCSSCTDGIQNQGETGIDCGGPCVNCQMMYPDSGIIGKNILSMHGDTIFLNKNLWHSARVVLSGPSAIKIKISNPQQVGYNWWFNLNLGNWLLENIDGNTQQVKTVNSAGILNTEFGFQTTGGGIARFDIYENNVITGHRVIIYIW